MVLKGKLCDVGLAELFQMLEVTSKGGNEGTLTIASDKRKIHMYFGKGRIRLLREGGISHTALGKLLLRAGKVTQAQLTEALRKQEESRTLLGQVLLNLEFVTEDDINNCLKTQLEEEICNVFLWEDARFEFTPGPPTAPFVDSSLLGKEIPFGVNEFLLEATRRVDEWSELLEDVKRTRTEFEVARKGKPPPDPSSIGFSYEDVCEVVQLIEKVRGVDEIVGRAPLSKLEVARVLTFLLRQGYIKRVAATSAVKPEDVPAPPEADWRTSVSVELASPKLQQEFEANPELREKIEKIGWASESREEAARKITAIADSMVMEGKLDNSVPVYQIALDLAPDNNVVRTKLVHLFVLQWNFADAAKTLVDGSRRQFKPPPR